MAAPQPQVLSAPSPATRPAGMRYPRGPPRDEPGPQDDQREVEDKRAGGLGEHEQDCHVLLRLRGALASGDQLASITDFI